MVEDPVWETKLLLGWETELLPGCFVASGRYFHTTLGVRHVGIVVGTTSHFQFGENPLGFEWGIHGFDDGICGLVLGLHTHKESLI